MNEGDKRTLTLICKRRTCEVCGESATHKLTFLLPNARTNPASSAYGKDNISWCVDDKMFVCEEHSNGREGLANEKGMRWCSSFPFNDRFKHMFLWWEEIKDKADSPSPSGESAQTVHI